MSAYLNAKFSALSYLIFLSKFEHALPISYMILSTASLNSIVTNGEPPLSAPVKNYSNSFKNYSIALLKL